MALIGRRSRLVSAWLAAAALLAPLTAAAQDETLNLRLRRTFGLSWGGDIQGSFLMIAAGPPDLVQVAFYVDHVILQVVEAPPFEARLHTGDFPYGPHQLSVEGKDGAGRILRSNTIDLEFVSSGVAWQVAGRIILPVLAIVGLVLIGTSVLVAVSSRSYRPGFYGRAGGAVCRYCGLPMSRHLLAPNLGRGKLERCPHCGRWSVAPRATTTELAEAEARLTVETQPVAPEISEEETSSSVGRLALCGIGAALESSVPFRRQAELLLLGPFKPRPSRLHIRWSQTSLIQNSHVWPTLPKDPAIGMGIPERDSNR